MKKTGFLILTTLALASVSALAGDITWSGRYRTEALSLNNPYLTNDRSEKSYLTNHLILEPKIVAADGLSIFGRFDLMNSALYQGSQVGQFMGSGPRGNAPIAGTTNASNSNSLSRNQTPGGLVVSELYVTWLQEFSSLSVGRMPIQFGLGLTHNAGKGDFDHWLNEKDLIAFKMVFGNLSVTPMYGKVEEGQPTSEDDINEYLIHVQYENPESDTAFGVLHEIRNSGKFGNDAPSSTTSPGSGFDGTSMEGWDGRMWNVYFSRGFEALTIGVEASFLNGNTGFRTAAGNDVNMNAYAVAAELDITPSEGRSSYQIKMGSASGDDATTTDRYEGYLINRNYDVANILFNYHVGGPTYDIFRTKIGGRLDDGADDEFISNAMWIAPSWNVKMGDKWDFYTRFVYANLMNSSSTISDKALGYEIDANFGYRPNSHLHIEFQSGILIPGAAFGNSTTSSYMLGTKAAINF